MTALDLDGLRALRERVAPAIKKTEYKYFGDYEMSDDQRAAVDTLVECGEALPALLARISTLEREVQQAREALREIAYMRPTGDIDRATGTRKLVERMEARATRALHNTSSEGAS